MAFTNILKWVGFCSLFAATLPAESLTLYVSPSGNDANDASASAPLASLEGARNRLRELSKAAPLGDVKIKLKKGVYFFDKSVVFDNSIVRKKSAKIEIEGEKGVIFHGGKRFDASVLKRVSDAEILDRLPPEADKSKLYSIDLKANGLENCGEFGRRGFMLYGVSQSEVFIDGKPTVLARYPNGAGLLEIGEVLSTVAAPKLDAQSIFKPAEGFERYKRWKNCSELYLTGRFSFGYSDAVIKVLKLDAANGIFYTENPIWGVHPGKKAFDKIKDKSVLHRAAIPSVMHRGYAAYNILEEIDADGEYVIDRKRGKIFIMLSDASKIKNVDVSLLGEAFIKLDNISDVEIQGISFCNSRAMGVELGGVFDIEIKKCKFFNLGLQGVKSSVWFKPFSDLNDLVSDNDYKLNGKTRNVEVKDCTFENLGCGGVYLCGGDARTLTHSKNKVKNCYFKNTSRINKTYSPAIWLTGCGATAENNTITANDHGALFFNGCEITMRRNYIYDVCRHGMDMGAVYSGRNVYQRGNVFEENFVYYINPDATVHIHGVYLDDCLSGVTLRRNIFCKAGCSGNAININKGFDNVITDNVFVDCKSPIMEFMRKNKDILAGLERESRTIFGREGVATIIKKYPAAADIMTRDQKNIVEGNRFYNCGKIKKQTQLNGAKVVNIDVNFKTWDLKKIEKYFGEDPLVRELTGLKFGCDISPED